MLMSNMRALHSGDEVVLQKGVRLVKRIRGRLDLPG